MKTETKAAMKALTEKATNSTVSGDALKFTQAALNLAHMESVLADNKRLEGEKQ